MQFPAFLLSLTPGTAGVLYESHHCDCLQDAVELAQGKLVQGFLFARIYRAGRANPLMHIDADGIQDFAASGVTDQFERPLRAR